MSLFCRVLRMWYPCGNQDERMYDSIDNLPRSGVGPELETIAKKRNYYKLEINNFPLKNETDSPVTSQTKGALTQKNDH